MKVIYETRCQLSDETRDYAPRPLCPDGRAEAMTGTTSVWTLQDAESESCSSNNRDEEKEHQP